MTRRSQTSELLELASELFPDARSNPRVQRALGAAQRARTELGLLGELVAFTLELDGTPYMDEVAPGVFVPRKRTVANKVREVRRWRPSR